MDFALVVYAGLPTYPQWLEGCLSVFWYLRIRPAVWYLLVALENYPTIWVEEW